MYCLGLLENKITQKVQPWSQNYGKYFIPIYD